MIVPYGPSNIRMKLREERTERRKGNFFYDLARIEGISFASSIRYPDSLLVYYGEKPFGVFIDSDYGSFTYLRSRIEELPIETKKRIDRTINRFAIRKYTRNKVPQLGIVASFTRNDY